MPRRVLPALLLFVSFVAACGSPLLTGGSDQTATGQQRGPRTTTDPNEADPDDTQARGRDHDPDFFAAVDTTELDPFFEAERKKAGFPGISVAVVRGGRLKWAKGYGLAHIAEQRPVTKDTVFMLASISKTVTAVALMQLLEDPSRGIGLDDAIDAKLPFRVRSPRFSSVPITYRMLLTHTSSLIDSDAYWATNENRPEGDSPTSLLAFERAYVTKSDSWSASRPGTRFAYSNTASALAGLLVEQISGQNLQDYCKAKIFAPLKMNESSWFFAGLDRNHVAMPYDTNNRPQGHYGYPDYPDGQLRTSAPQLARFFMMFANGGEHQGARILSAATVKEMQREQLRSIAPGQGLAWYQAESNPRMFGHTGSDVGVTTEAFIDVDSGAGFVLLTNGGDPSIENEDTLSAYSAMEEKLMDLATTLP